MVDIRLYQHDVIGEVQTLVQVKRYAKHRPIRLDAVAALRALVSDQKAHRDLFVTTSRYLRSARRFADRQGRVIQLADISDMVRWCERAESSVNTATDLLWLDALCARSKAAV
jgi:restriction endonuclease Mrr